MLGLSGAANANLLINGGFEKPIVTLIDGSYAHRNGTELAGWTAFSSWQGIVQFRYPYIDYIHYIPSEGLQAVQLEVPGDWIMQSFATVVGQTYRLTFDLSMQPNDASTAVGISVGSVSATRTGTSEAFTPQVGIDFVADSALTTLKFESPVTVNEFGRDFPQLDKVSVTAIPEPEDYLLMLAGLGVLGLVARRRRHAAT